MKIGDLVRMARKGVDSSLNDLEEFQDWCKEINAFELLPYFGEAIVDFRRWKKELNDVSYTIDFCDLEMEEFFYVLDKLLTSDGKDEPPETEKE